MTDQEKKERRLEIIKDVIKQIETERLNLVTGNYIRWNDYENMESLLDGEDPQQKIDEVQQHCSVCAKGALFLSCVRKYDSISSYELLNSDVEDLLHEKFTEFNFQNLCLVECAFERHASFYDEYNFWNELEDRFIYPEEVNRAVEFGKKYESIYNLLRAILNNMLENDGVFKP